MAMTIGEQFEHDQYGNATGYEDMTATGDDSDDVFVAWASYDWAYNGYFLEAYEQDWVIFGGGGNDDLTAGDEDDHVGGGDGNDTLRGLDGDDELQGGEGHDMLFGGAGDDDLWGGLGDDWLDGGTGTDMLRGGEGNDSYVVRTAQDVVIEYASEGYDSVMQAMALYQLGDNVEDLLVHAGWTAPATLIGNALANRLVGGVAADLLQGGGGNDRLEGGAGADVMKGGTGNDTYVVTEAADQVVELAGEGTDTVQSFLASLTLAANVENVQLFVGGTACGNALANAMTGSLYADTLSGFGGNDTLDGFLGDDWLYGGDGSDTLLGSVGHDRLWGEAGSDTIHGGSGNDLIVGGAGADQLRGDTGNDTFRYYAAGESAGAAHDVIHGFVRGQDKIDLSSIDANAFASGNQAFSFSSGKPVFTGAGDLWVVAGRTGSSVFADLNGDGVEDLQIDVAGVTGLTAADFVL